MYYLEYIKDLVELLGPDQEAAQINRFSFGVLGLRTHTLPLPHPSSYISCKEAKTWMPSQVKILSESQVHGDKLSAILQGKFTLPYFTLSCPEKNIEKVTWQYFMAWVGWYSDFESHLVQHVEQQQSVTVYTATCIYKYFDGLCHQQRRLLPINVSLEQLCGVRLHYYFHFYRREGKTKAQNKFTRVSLWITPTEMNQTWFSSRTSVDLDPQIKGAST